MAEFGGSGVREFVKDAALAAFASATADGFSEVVGLPYVNERSPIPLVDPEATIAETILYGAGLALTTLGGVGVFAGKSLVPGFGKEALAYGVGILVGTQFYENQIVKWFGIRNLRHPVYK